MARLRGFLYVFIVSWVGIIVYAIVTSKGSFGHVAWVVEGDGYRDVTYTFGRFSFDRHENSPETKVSEDFWRLLDKMGAVLGPELKQGADITRTLDGSDTTYGMCKTVVGDHAALVARYAAYSPPSSLSLRTAKWGQPQLIIDVRLLKKGSMPGTDQCSVGVVLRTSGY